VRPTHHFTRSLGVLSSAEVTALRDDQLTGAEFLTLVKISR